jgi:hypothetical protein
MEYIFNDKDILEFNDKEWDPFDNYDDCDGDGESEDEYIKNGKIEKVNIIYHNNNTIAGFHFIFSNGKTLQFCIYDIKAIKECGRIIDGGSFAINPDEFNKIIGFNLKAINEGYISSYPSFNYKKNVKDILGGFISKYYEYKIGQPESVYNFTFTNDKIDIIISIPCYRFYKFYNEYLPVNIHIK